MDNVQLLKLSNEVSMKLMRNEFPLNGRTVITVNMKNNQPASVDVKNVKARAKEDKNNE